MTPTVLAITGASGAIYSVRLLQQLVLADEIVELVVSPSGWSVLGQELGDEFQQAMPELSVIKSSLLRYRDDAKWCNGVATRWGTNVPSTKFANVQIHGYEDYFCKIASGSAKTKGMVICPCSGATLAGVAHALGNNLVQRAADVHLKERRPLILVPRETPLSTLQLENMHRVSQAGATVLPAMPGWYHGVQDLLSLVDFIVARILDHLGIQHQLMQRWASNS